MGSVTAMKATFEDGKEAQFQEMMQQLSALQAKYKGVRGELLAKVRDEFEKLKPSSAPEAKPVAVSAVPVAPVTQAAGERRSPRPPVSPARAPFPAKMLPSCRVCGRGMKVNEADASSLICERGHTRSAQ
jgi:hypothetical protein